MLSRVYKFFPNHDYATKFSVAIVYAIAASVGVKIFYSSGHIYSSGITGIAQIISTISERTLGYELPISLLLFILNVPLFFLGWHKIGHKFTIFTFITVLLTSVMMQIIPAESITQDPIICAIFGGATMGAGIGYALKNGLSSGGLDFISIAVRKKTGKSIGSISMGFNFGIMLAAGILFGWPSAFYSALGIFVNGKVTDAVFTKQKKMQVIIVTKFPDEVASTIQKHIRRGITIIHEAEGAYRHDKQTVLITIVTRFELPELRMAMRESDPQAFVSISDNVQILGRFYEEEL